MTAVGAAALTLLLLALTALVSRPGFVFGAVVAIGGGITVAVLRSRKDLP